MIETLKPLKPQDVLFDKDIASYRIRNRPDSFNRIKSVSDLAFSPDDFRMAQDMCATEREIVLNGDHVLTEEGFFRGLSYCSLIGHKIGEIYQSRDELDQFDHILSVIRCNVDSTREIEEIVRDVTMGEFPRLGLKTSSLLLRMCGAKYIIPVDSITLEMMYFHGYNCETPTRLAQIEDWQPLDNSRKKALLRTEYFKAEMCVLDLANKYGVDGNLLQMAILSKFSSYRKKQNLAKVALH